MEGKRLKELRERMGISQTDFAIMIGESKQNLYKYEHNIITNVPSDKIEVMAEILGCSPAYLMGWQEKETPQEEERAKRIRELYKYVDAETLEAAENDPQLMEFIQLFMNTSPENRPAVLQILKGLQHKP